MYVIWVEQFKKEKCTGCNENKYLSNVIFIGDTEISICDKCFYDFKKKINK